MGMHHSHHPGHTHTAVQSFNKSFAIAVTVTLIYSFSEIFYGLVANSTSLLADAVHNLGDVLGLILAWIANWLLTLPPRKRYSYGFKRTTIIASLLNAFMLVGTSAVIAYEAIDRLLFIEHINETLVIIVGAIGIVVNGGCSLLFMKGALGDINIKGAFLHLVADALILVGVVVSAIIIRYTQLMWIDPVIGLIIVGIVLWSTWGLLRDSLHLILDAVPRYIDQSGVSQYLAQYPGVKSIHDLHIWGLSTRQIALTAHLIIPNGTLTDADYKKINHDLHTQYNIDHITLQVEKGSQDDPCLRTESC